jgi:DNA primase
MPAIRRCPVPSDPVELTKQIKAASDIVAVVGSYLTVKPAGKTYKALCPFHDDSNPSLDVDPQRQRYRCWVCHAHGDVFGFVQHMEKVGFKEARAILAARVGIKIDEARSPEDHHRTRLLEVMRWGQAKYQHCLLEEPTGEAARKYLGGRKLSGKTVRDFGLGFAPLAGDWLVRLAAAERIDTDALVEVGLIASRQEQGGHYDRFRDRVMFPIRDVRGQTIAFGGRIMPESPYAARAPKYYNSAETPLFSKSDVLYGLDMARHAAAGAGYLAVVEGYTDVMMAHQCGVPQVVATMGTAFNARHAAQVRRLRVPKVVLVFDADAAGDSAWHRGMKELLDVYDVEIAIAQLPRGLDPCDLLVQPGGPEEFTRALAGAKDALDYRLDWQLEKHPAPNIETTRRIVDDVLGTLAIADPARSTQTQVKRELIVTRLAHRLGLRQETVWARLSELQKEHRLNQREQTRPTAALVQTSAARSTKPEGQPPAPKSSREYAAERNLLEILLADPGLVPKAAAAISPDELTHTGLRRLLAELYRSQAAGAVPDLDWLREQLIDRPDLFAAAVKLQDVGHQMQERERWLGILLRRFAEMKIEAVQREIKDQLATADGDQAVELLRKLQQTDERKKNAG